RRSRGCRGDGAIPARRAGSVRARPPVPRLLGRRLRPRGPHQLRGTAPHRTRLRPPTDGAGPAAPAPVMRLVSVWLHVLGIVAWVDRLVLLLAVAIGYLGLAVSRA